MSNFINRFSKHEVLYGLPDDLEFPLDTEENIVRSARYFSFCDNAKRHILATNINDAAKKNNVIIPLSSKDYFFPFADKSIVKIIDNLENDFRNMDYGTFVNNYIEKNKNFVTFSFLLIKNEEELNEFCISLRDAINSKNNKDLDALIAANSILYFKNKKFCEIKNFIKNKKVDDNMLFDALLFDLTNTAIESRNDEGLLDKVIPAIFSSIYLLSREKLTPYAMERVAYTVEILRLIDETNRYTEKLNEPFSYDKTSYEDSDDELIDSVLAYLSLGNIIETKNYFESRRQEIESQIDTINMKEKYIKHQIPHFDSAINPYDSNGEEDSNKMKIRDFFESKDGVLNEEELNNFLETIRMNYYSDEIEPHGLIFSLSDADKIQLDCIDFNYNEVIPFYINTDEGNDVYFISLDNQIYLVTTTMERGGQLFLVSINLENDNLSFINIQPISNFYRSGVYEKESLTEGFTVEKDGTVKLSWRKRLKFMDEYASNHKLLLEAAKTLNLEEMKLILAYDFMLIDKIETKLKGKTKNLTKKEEEMMKARMFLMNDFKTYIKFIHQYEKNFNFTEYYRNCEAIQNIISIDRNTISGIKMLFRSLMA